LGISLILNPGESVPTLRSLFLEGGNEGHEDAPTPDFIEGGRGTEVNDSNGKLYGFERHYLGNGTIIYRAMVEDAGREFRGELSGEFDRLSGVDSSQRASNPWCARRSASRPASGRDGLRPSIGRNPRSP